MDETSILLRDKAGRIRIFGTLGEACSWLLVSLGRASLRVDPGEGPLDWSLSVRRRGRRIGRQWTFVARSLEEAATLAPMTFLRLLAKDRGYHIIWRRSIRAEEAPSKPPPRRNLH